MPVLSLHLTFIYQYMLSLQSEHNHKVNMPIHLSIGLEPTEHRVQHQYPPSHIHYAGNSIGMLKGEGECQ
jgi:hypothetical protein